MRELLQQAVTVDAESERAGADSMLRAALAIARVHPEQCFAGSGDGDDEDEKMVSRGAIFRLIDDSRTNS